MFLERFSNQPTPSASPPPLGQRSYSPAPRRPNHLAPTASRPALNQRPSSLTLISRANSSTGSLPGVARALNASTLRQQITPPPYVEDPLEVLKKIVGPSLPRDDVSDDEDGGASRPDELVEDLDFGGLSLEEFVDREEAMQQTWEIELGIQNAQSAEEYEKERDKFEDLHRSIIACDNVLKSVEISLAGFQKDLGVVSTEIETLQTRSTALNTKLENRKVVEKLLGPAVEEVSISPAVVKTISEAPIDENWLKALAELQKKLKIIENKSSGVEKTKAAADIKPLLENLASKTVERIRDYLVAQIKAVRSPNINVRIIQQQNLVRYKDIFIFLVKNYPQLAEEIGKAYINTIRWYYLNHFTRYEEALRKLTLIRVDKTDTLGGDPSAPKNKPAGAPPTHDAHNIGRRADILKTTNQSAISSYLAEEDKSTHQIEVPFRSFNLALIDNVCAEYSFLTQFFATDTYNQMSRRCAAIFEPTFALSRSLVTDLVSTSYDCLGILLCVRLNQHSAFELQRRKVPVADSYVNAVNMLLWPRFQVAMDAHAESIKQLAATVSARTTAATAASKLSFTTSASSSSAGNQSTAPHFLTQRFSQFLYGILAISREAGNDEPVSSSLGRLRAEYEGFLQKASKGAGADQKKRNRFLGNNYALVLTIIADAEGKLAGEQKAYFEEVSRRVEEGK